MKCEEVIKCSIDQWYPKFRKDTFPTTLVKLSEQFLQYLSEDGIVVPVFDDTEDPPEDFHVHVYKEVQEALKKLNNIAFIKLNWSSPKDARWILPNSNLQCTSVDDLYILLKSSDRIVHDLTQPFKQNTVPRANPDNHVTEIRAYYAPERGVSQRDISTHWPYIKEQRKEILHHISTFFEEKIQNRFPLQNYVFDIVRYDKERIKIVDFNPFGTTTDSLLFTWDELTSSGSLENLPEDVSAVADCYLPEENRDGSAVLRHIKASMAMQSTSYRLNNYPVDVVADPEQFFKTLNTDNFGSETESDDE